MKKFIEQRNVLAKDEDASQHAFQLLVQELTHDVDEAEKLIVALITANTILSEDTVLKKPINVRLRRSLRILG